MAYVAVSRGHVAYLFTNDRERLPVALRHEVSQQSAHVPQIGVEQAMPKPQPEISQRIEYGYGISMEGDALDGGKDHLFRIRE